MYNGVGIRTPRGSGTSGFVQRNLAAVNPTRKTSYALKQEQEQQIARANVKQHAPDSGILEHDKKRRVEVKLMEWAHDRNLLDADIPEDELQTLLAEQRKKITEELSRQDARSSAEATRFKDETHRRLAAKSEQHRQLGSALEIGADYKEGQAFDRDRQEFEKQQRINQRLAAERERRQKVREETERQHRALEDKRRDALALLKDRDDSDEERGSKKRKRRDSRSRSPSRSRSRSRSPGQSRSRGSSPSRSPDARRSSPRRSPDRRRRSGDSDNEESAAKRTKLQD